MKATVLVKHQGLIIPKDYLQKVLHEAAPNCLGIACFNPENTSGLMMNHWPALQEVGSTMEEIAEAIMELQEEIKAGSALLAFSDNAGQVMIVDGEHDTPDMQPYPVMTDSDGGVHLVATLVGDFSAFAQKERPGEYFAVLDDLAPRLMDMFSAQGEDLSKMMSYLRGSQVAQKDLKKLSNGETGIVTLFASDGDILTLNKRDADITQTDWGWTNHVSTAKVEEKKEEPKKSKLSFNLGARKPAAAPVADATKAEPVVADKVKTETSAEPATLVKRVKCPSHITGKNAIRSWYEKNAGFCPQNFKNKPEVDVVEKLKDIKDLKEAMIQNGSATAEPKAKDTEPHTVKAEHAKPVESRVPGLIPAAMKDKMMKDSVIMKMVDRSSQVIKDREKIMAEEAKTSSFPEQLPKIGLEGLWGATDADYDHLILEYPDAVKSALLAYRGMHLKVEDMKRANNKHEETGPEATSPATKQEAAPAPSAAPVRKLSLTRKVA